MGKQDLNLLAAGNALRLLESNGVFHGCLCEGSNDIAPVSAINHYQEQQSTSPISNASVAASTSALLPSAVGYHRFTSQGKIVLGVVLPIVAVA